MSDKKDKTILIVDDDPVNACWLERAFSKHGMRVLVAADGNIAIKALESHDIDLCITDLAMPEKTGLDLLRYIRSDEQLEEMPVIVRSTFAVSHQRQILAYQPVRIFKKSVPMKDLLSVSFEALGVRRPS